ncbi:hypothetical protein BLL42_09650 [Pseudomonas frederiksbergensis]|uniref:Uncharacterized protein n=1 Tax=Pseudomonas frederiksbergensis TaxID=104087 RepID=A0A1J0EIV8_9PSED|nr:hypothetical protein [Pseudomonas frederiksbergensis]APC15982.1 hypothetical protein BLL42_09650 [Pseudomonas frederiksbergensis]
MHTKNVKYISEQETCKRLSKDIGREISREEIIELSEAGVIPAYMEFRPTDSRAFPEKRFYFVHALEEDVCIGNGFETELKALPFPLREGGIFRAAEWAFHGNSRLPTLQTVDYKVFAKHIEGHLEPISEDHFVRVYAPLEVKPSSVKVKRYFSNKMVEPTIHGYCNAFAGFDIETVGEWRGMSPFTDDPDYLNPDRRRPNRKSANEPSESMGMELIIISALKQIVETLSAQKGSKKYTQGDIARMIEDIYPSCISDTTINNIFSAANKKRLEVIARAKQKQADDAKLMKDAF